MAEKRSVFEEVESSEKISAAPGVIDRGRGTAQRGAIRIWLMILFALVVLMVAVGGLTRLTDSGLSITEWAPISGVLPPLSEAAWQLEFEKYKAIPEFQLQNSDMDLAGFKYIYWWEWGHRQLGRVIGLVWAAGFFWFLLRKQIPTGWTGRLAMLGVLGGLQGAIGWWMVSSGLTGTMVDVASYRLAIHLGLAFVILGLIFWYVLRLGRTEADLLQARRSAEPKLKSMVSGLLHAAYLQVLVGALVAGIDAGRSYTDWPLMAGEFFPSLAFDMSPWWRNFFENAAMVQFIHRMLGYLVFVFGVVIFMRSRKSANLRTRTAFGWMMLVLAWQVVLGIATILYAAPVGLALMHQLSAVLLICLILNARFNAMYPFAQSVRG